MIDDMEKPEIANSRVSYALYLKAKSTNKRLMVA